MTQNNPTHITISPETKQVIVTRVFDAPREMVFQVYTDPKLIPQWWGPRNLTTRVDKMDVRPGGVWRFIQRDAEGNEYAFNGIYREIIPPERIVYTFEYESLAGHDLLETVIFEAQGGKTKVTTTDLFQTVEDLNGMVQSGMEEGVNESNDRFAELLQALQSAPRKENL